MRYGLLILSFLFFAAGNVFSQSETANEKIAEIKKIDVQDDSLHTYKFDHKVDYFEALENRLITILNRDQEVVKHLSIKDFKCVVSFRQDTPLTVQKEKLEILVRDLGYDGFKLK